MAVLAYFGGLRRSEAVLATVGGLDGATFTFWRPKVRNWHAVGLPPEPVAVLEAWIRAERSRRPMNRRSLLFVSQKGGALSGGHLARILRRACLEAGIPSLKAHSHVLRRSRATHLLEASDGDYRLAQAALGHKSVSTTEAYLCSNREADLMRRYGL